MGVNGFKKLSIFLRALPFYGTVSSEYNACKDMIEQSNRAAARHIALSGLVLFSVFGMISCLNDFLAVFRYLYICSAAVLLLTYILLQKRRLSATLIVYLQMLTIYAFATGLALAVTEERGTVSLIVMPLLSAIILDRLDRLSVINLLFTAVYCWLMFKFKAERLIAYEAFSMVVSFVLSLLFHYTIQAEILRRMRTEQKNKDLIQQLTLAGNNLRTKAETDALTGLYNRCALIEHTQRALGTGEHAISALCIIDLDDFKTVNDTYGHQCGDKTLVEVAQILKAAFRPSDVVGRLGGDEFMIYLSGFTNQKQLCERVQAMHIGLTTPASGNKSITTSIGVAIITDDAITFDKLYKQADAALYEAKKTGKNRICFTSAVQDTTE